MDDQLWYKNAIFYQVYLRAFKDSNGDGRGDLRGLTDQLDYLKELGIDCIWLMPIYPSPLKDDGYDIADFYAIADIYGDLEDFRILLNSVHERGMRLIMDLVMNHTSDRHPWFQSARSDRDSPFREFYVWSDSDGLYEQARIIFLDIEPSNWTWDEKAGQYFWHRFYASQPDLNYDSPEVQQEMLNVARFWLDLGIDGFRADAVPYLFEREGTNCENLPETHEYLKRLRAMMDIEYPGRILLCEANQLPEDVRQYFGNGDEFQMGFDFPIMPRLFMAVKKGLAADLRDILRKTPAIPSECQWCTFLRNHDELTLEMVTPEERAWMWEQYAPEPRMRLNLGIRRRLAPLLDNDARKIKLMNSLLLTLPGSPIIYYGDEIGMGDNIWLADRNGVRTPMQWSSGQNAGFSSALADALYAPVIEDDEYGPERVNVMTQRGDPDSIWNTVRHMLQTRKDRDVFGWGTIAWLDDQDARLAAYRRQFRSDSIVAVHNLSDANVQFNPPPGMQARVWDLLTGRLYDLTAGSPNVELEPYQYLWLSAT
ncbi:MAG TPA: maltose alpha-D-glucosyltransferase [Anaerolineales bacterium]|nr:maltose alpha-D-glucosyltransferase [Anaerolineales bacterium]